MTRCRRLSEHSDPIMYIICLIITQGALLTQDARYFFSIFYNDSENNKMIFFRFVRRFAVYSACLLPRVFHAVQSIGARQSEE